MGNAPRLGLVHPSRPEGGLGATRRAYGAKGTTMELLNLVKPLVEAFFSSTVNVQPGLLFLLFFVGVMLGWFFGH
jgi:hypothetical protein